MNVIVRAGTAVIGGTVVSLASDTQIAISAPDATYPRFDLITLKSNGTIGYYTGTPEAPVAVDTAKPETYVKPKPPATPAGEVALAEVFVPAGATAIDKIIDRRIITNLNASQITGGRLAMSRMPDGDSGKILIAQGAGADPVWSDPDFNLIKVAGTPLTARDWSSDFAKLQNLDIALSALRDFFRPLTKGSIFNQSVTANTNIFSTSLTPSLATATNPSYFRIFACFNASGVLSVVKTKGTTTVTMQLNSGNALNANCLYAFDIIVEYDESVNLRYSVNATVLELKVVEIASTVV
jgi:hypothetical protein